MLKHSTLLTAIIILTFTACESPNDVPANRKKLLVGSLEDHEHLAAVGFPYSTCPDDRQIAFGFIIGDDDPGASFEIRSLDLYHELGEINIVNLDELPYNTPEPIVLSAIVHYANVTFTNGERPADQGIIEFTLIINDHYAVPLTVDMNDPIATNQEIFDVNFETTRVGGETDATLEFCNHCTEGWTITSIDLNAYKGEGSDLEDLPPTVFSIETPVLPHLLRTGTEVSFPMTFRPVTFGEHKGDLTINMRTASGTRFTRKYALTGIGE